MPEPSLPRSKRNSRYQRARIRQFLFTVGPDKISGGRIRRRHLNQDIEVREIEAASPRWPTAFDGLRIGHVSDFHLGELLPLERALQVVQQLRDQEPDLVACTGDVVDLDHLQAGPLLAALADIRAPMGAALVLGNHDELHCSETLCRLAIEAGVTVLRNEVVSVAHNGHHLTIGGIHWAKSAVACARNIDATCGRGGSGGGGVDLLLAHNPKAFLHAADIEIPLTLAGHTHGGQIALKHRPNANLALSHRHRVGLFQQGPSRLYVTSGVGAWFPLRINCPAEIAIITMRHEPEPQPAAGQKARRAGRGLLRRRR